MFASYRGFWYTLAINTILLYVGEESAEMNKEQLNRQMILLQKDALKVQSRMNKIAKKLDIPENEDIKKIISEIEQLIRWE